MFRNVQRGYALDIGGTSHKFETLEDLRFALASRAEAPLAKLDELEQLSSEDLERQARGIRGVEHKLTRMLGEAYDEPALLSNALRELDIRIFSEDHGWRSIVAALNQSGPEYDEVRRLVLVHYLRYLSSRQGLVKRIYAQREHHLPPEEPQANPRETSIFEAEDRRRSERDSSQADTRLLRGEPVRLRIPRDGRLVLYLSLHRFELELGARRRLVDEKGTVYELAKGRASVGRLPGNDVVVDPSFRGVSRRHLLIDLGREGEIEMVDLSSHGTFVPRRAILED